MMRIKRIVSYIFMLHVIYRHLTGTLAAKVSINQNITGLLGNKDTHLTCSFYLEKGEQMISVHLFAKNITEDFDDIKIIALFKPGRMSRLLTSGHYLSNRVTLTNITTTSTNATMTLHILKCTDEKDYMCICHYSDMEGAINSQKSEQTRIVVKASPSRPDDISSFIASSIIPDTQVNSTSNILRGSDKTSTRTDQNSNPSFSKLRSSREGLTLMKPPINIREGDILMFICTGNIGKPPGKLIWQKISLLPNITMTYDNITTTIEKIPGRCSFKGTTNLTVQISAEDLKARIRCFEESQANVSGMYVETKPLDVHFQTRLVNVNKQPNLKQYDRKTDQINLTCTTIGNPEPEYRWFKQDNNRNILSGTNTYVIGNVNRNSSGIYICEAFNIINNVVYRNSYAVAIDIVDKLLQTESESMQFFVVHVAYAVSFTCTAVVLILCFAIRKRYCNREKMNIHSDDQENISVDNDYAEIDRISYHEGNLHSDRTETSNQPITEEETVLENTPISTYSSKNKSTTAFSYLYVNTDIFNTNENRKVPVNHETTSDHPNGLGNDQIGVDNTFDSDNSESDTLHVNQYVNTTSLRVPNVYEDLNHMTVDTHKYESPHMEGNTTLPSKNKTIN